MAVKKKTSGKKAAKAVKRTGKPAKKTASSAAKKKAAKPSPKKSAGKTAAAGGAGRTAKAPAAPRMPVSISKRKEQLKRLLLSKRAEVVEGLEARMGQKLVREAGQKIDSAMDTADQSAQDVDQGIDYSLIEMKYEQYKDIADAFRRLENDTYGLCEECGEEISIKRLEVNPLARYCIECKTRKEEFQKIQREETRFKE